MTGYQSKRAAAQDKLDDDDTQVYQDHDDALTIAYQSGFYDGKKAAQSAQEPVCPACKAEVLYECVACSNNNYPPQPAQEPVAYLCKPDQHGLFDRPTPDKACEDCFPVYAAPPQLAQELWRESASDYERGVIDGRQMQAQSSVDKAVNRMAQPAQEPVLVVEKEPDYMSRGHFYTGTKPHIDPTKIWSLPIGTKLYTHPPQRPWVGLTNEERSGIEDYCEMIIGKAAFDAIEAKLKEKNT